MGLNILLESQNKFEVGPTIPKTPRTSHSNKKKAEERVVYQCKNVVGRDTDEQKLNATGFAGSNPKDLFLHTPTSPSRKSMPSKLISFDVKDSTGVGKRGSIYQSSQEVKRMQKLTGGRKKLAPYINDDTFLSFELINSTSHSRSSESTHFPRLKKEPALELLQSQSKRPSVDNNQALLTSNTEFLDLSFRDLPEERSKISISYSDVIPEKRSSTDSLLGILLQTEETNENLTKATSEFAEEVQVEVNYSDHQFSSIGVNANYIYEKDAICLLPKSSSEKAGVSSSYLAERDILKSSHKTHFNPFKKMLDPMMKSKSLQNLLRTEPRTISSSTPDSWSLSRYKVKPRSLLNDFSKATQKIDNERESGQAMKIPTSPAHLHAILKWDFNHGDPSFEFSVKDPEDVMSAKTWKTESAFKWVYTFHCCKMKSNIIGHGKKYPYLHPSLMIGQMLASCYLFSDVNETGLFDNSAVMEFILYDIARTRRSISIERTVSPSYSNQASVLNTDDGLVMRSSSEFDSDPSTSCLHQKPEIAAIVTQLPFSKKEAMNAIEERDYNCEETSFQGVEQERVAAIGDPSRPAFVNVITPSARHGLPNKVEVGPSSLLDRWRFGGGCDCGGWDMGCPILVFDNEDNDNLVSLSGTQQLAALFAKGKKEKVPALTITATGKGQYAVDFHAQFSKLQAFAVCITILHSSEALPAIIEEDRSKHRPPHSDSFKLILEDEVRHIIEAVAEGKGKERKVELTTPSFFLDPPFSPMGRV